MRKRLGVGVVHAGVVAANFFAAVIQVDVDVACYKMCDKRYVCVAE